MSKCVICNRNFKNKQALGLHIIRSHKLSIKDYKRKFQLLFYCEKCGKELRNQNKTNRCTHCRDRTGINNPFFGKKHDQNTIAVMKEKCKNQSINLWKDNEYRKKVISGTSKPRNTDFKISQSKRISQWYVNNPNQRSIRSLNMTKSWEDGKITKNYRNSYNKSKLERQLFDDIKKLFPSSRNDLVLKTEFGYYFPDIVIPEYRFIIELFGDYWHANPLLYSPDDIVHHNLKAITIWNNDKIRLYEIEKLKYNIRVIWEKEYKKDRDSILESIQILFEWEEYDF